MKIMGLIFMFLSVFSCNTSKNVSTGKEFDSESLVQRVADDGDRKTFIISEKNVLQVFLNYSPTSGQAGQALLPTCLPPFPADYVLGQASCQTPNSSNEVPITANQVQQLCGTIDKASPSKSLVIPNCTKIKVVFYTFKPNIQFNFTP
jgi:hypothetical protein